MKMRETPGWIRPTTRLLLVVLAPLALDGCVSVGVEHSAPPVAALRAPETGTLEARLFENSADAKASQASPRPVSWALFSLSKPSGTPVREGRGSVWSVTDLEPGKYKIVVSWGPRPGEPGLAEAGRTDGRFTLAAGETARARVLVRTIKTWVYIALAIGIVLATLIVIDDLNKGRTPDISWE